MEGHKLKRAHASLRVFTESQQSRGWRIVIYYLQMFPLAPQGVGQSGLPAQPHNVHKGTEECHCWTAGDLVELHATLRSLMLKVCGSCKNCSTLFPRLLKVILDLYRHWCCVSKTKMTIRARIIYQKSSRDIKSCGVPSRGHFFSPHTSVQPLT